MMLVSFLNFAFNLGIVTRGFTVWWFRSSTMSEGFSPSPTRSKTSLSVLTNCTFTFSLRAVSCIFAMKNRSSTKMKMGREASESSTGAAS